MDKEIFKTLIPIIRQYLPAKVAAEILGVQPMNLTDPEPFELGTYDKENGTVWYWVKPEKAPALDFTHIKNTQDYWGEVEQWCTNTFGPRDAWAESTGPGGWSASNGKYYFLKESDRTLFILKWCS